MNITLDDLRRKRFVHHVFDALEASGVGPRYLCLELTEQTMLADALGASTIVAELRRAGIRITIDDFGTGYSSLEHIRVFEVDALKIDKGFVQRIGRSRTDEAIVDSILAIAGRLGVKVTAEGIEEPEALEYLRQRGCHEGQGFLFSPAVPVEQFAPGRSWATRPEGVSCTSSMRVPRRPFGWMKATVVPRDPGRGALSMGVAPAATIDSRAWAQSSTR